MALLQWCARITPMSRAQTPSTYEEKTFLKSPKSSRNCFAHGVARAVSFSSLVMLGFFFMRVCPKIAAETCWRERPPFCICFAIPSDQPTRRIVCSMTIGTTPNVRCASLCGICLLFWDSLSQFLLITARKPRANLFQEK